jgi:O-antigen ligase
MALNVRIIFARSVAPARMLQAFILVVAGGLLWTPNVPLGVQQVLETVVPFGLLIYFWRATGDEELWTTMAFTNGTAAALGGMVFFARGYDLLFETSKAWGIEHFFNPNSVAYLPLGGLFSICLGMRRASPRGRLVLALLAIVNSGWVFLGGSRGGILVAILCIVFILLRMESLRLRAGFLVVCLLIGLAVYVTFNDRVEHSIERIALLLDKNSDAKDRTSGRSDLLIGGIRIFESRPWLGVGTGGFSWHWLRLRNGAGMGNYGLCIPRAAHSGWIRTLSENGVVGAALHGAFVLSFAFAGWRKRREGHFLLGLFVTCVLALAFLSIDMSARGPWFLAMAATAILYGPGPRPVLVGARRLSPGAGMIASGKHATP